MQALALIVIAGSVIGILAILAARQRHLADPMARWPRILLGVIPGIVGVVLVVVPQMDVVPDEWEGAIWIAVAIALSVAAVVGTIWRLARA
ncbi:MAG: hypothetical protein OEV61_11110 [Chloroflexota bacterium]|nr:hypothetical protein [Chloroflexota bacterium]MDH5244301.1 hypothetical protein [Chloroflexota bacterium]